MLLTTLAAELAPGDQTFTFVVPGDKQWKIRSVYAVAARDTGGAPDRAYTLTVATSTGIVLAVGAADAGSEPGDCTVTWTNAPGATSEAGMHGVTLAPFNPPTLQPGYTIVGTIVNPAAADEWSLATVWYDFALTTAQ